MKPGSSSRCASRHVRLAHPKVVGVNAEGISVEGTVSHLRCHRHFGHAGPHTAPTGKTTFEWRDA